MRGHYIVRTAPYRLRNGIGITGAKSKKPAYAAGFTDTGRCLCLLALRNVRKLLDSTIRQARHEQPAGANILVVNMVAGKSPGDAGHNQV